MTKFTPSGNADVITIRQPGVAYSLVRYDSDRHHVPIKSDSPNVPRKGLAGEYERTLNTLRVIVVDDRWLT